MEFVTYPTAPHHNHRLATVYRKGMTLLFWCMLLPVVLSAIPRLVPMPLCCRGQASSSHLIDSNPPLKHLLLMHHKTLAWHTKGLHRLLLTTKELSFSPTHLFPLIGPHPVMPYQTESLFLQLLDELSHLPQFLPLWMELSEEREQAFLHAPLPGMIYQHQDLTIFPIHQF